MAKYEVRGYRMEGSTKLCFIMDTDKVAFFSGYSFMGDAEWVDSNVDAKWMELEEAEAIRKDLEASDDEPNQGAESKQPKMISSETILNRLQARWTNALEEGKKWGPDDRVYQRKVEWCIGMKELVEELLGTPVNLQLDGLVTTGF